VEQNPYQLPETDAKATRPAKKPSLLKSALIGATLGLAVGLSLSGCAAHRRQQAAAAQGRAVDWPRFYEFTFRFSVMPMVFFGAFMGFSTTWHRQRFTKQSD